MKYLSIIHSTKRLQNEYRKNTQAGFTLIETFVAVSLLMLALVGPLTLAQQSLTSTTSSADQITAFYLAQDAMEYIRNVRDSNIKAGDDWLDGFSGLDCLNNTCRIDTSTSQPITAAVQACSGSQCQLRYDAATNRYGYNGAWTPSQFSREITMTVIDASREVIVDVTVSWVTGGFNGSFTATQSIFNFAP